MRTTAIMLLRKRARHFRWLLKIHRPHRQHFHSDSLCTDEPSVGTGAGICTSPLATVLVITPKGGNNTRVCQSRLNNALRASASTTLSEEERTLGPRLPQPGGRRTEGKIPVMKGQTPQDSPAVWSLESPDSRRQSGQWVPGEGWGQCLGGQSLCLRRWKVLETDGGDGSTVT